MTSELILALKIIFCGIVKIVVVDTVIVIDFAISITTTYESEGEYHVLQEGPNTFFVIQGSIPIIAPGSNAATISATSGSEIQKAKPDNTRAL